MLGIKFPDPKDASPNEPCVLVSKAQVLKLINQHHKSNFTKPNEETKRWFVNEAFQLGWTDANFRGMQCLLVKHF